ncbi:VOC family protein [Streptomyces sp. KM273126]|uniref:VOC family protein n=1 Tax=Streptomyces sp. KM273126 TaxID=2545247 RepID=UPI0037D9DAD3
MPRRWGHGIPRSGGGTCGGRGRPCAPGSPLRGVPESKIVKNRVHLDVRVGTGLVGDERLATLEAECARLVALGATHVQTLYADEENESCIPMLDVEGNEFCIE